MENYNTKNNGPKKLYIFYVLEVLKNHTMEGEYLSNEEIINFIYDDFKKLKLDRKTVWQNIKSLQELTKTHPDFFSFEIEHKTRKGYRYNCLQGNSLKENMNIIEKAINEHKRIKFKYDVYDIYKKRRLEDNAGYYVTPYFIVDDKNGKKVFVCKNEWVCRGVKNGREVPVDGDGGLSNFKVYRMKNIEIVDDDYFSPQDIQQITKEEYRSKHYYFYGDKQGEVKFKLVREKAEEFLIDEIVEDFGDLAEFSKDKDELYVTIHGVIKALEVWAYKFIDCVEVVSPPEVRQNVMNEVAKGLKRYGITCENKNLEKIKNRMI